MFIICTYVNVFNHSSVESTTCWYMLLVVDLSWSMLIYCWDIADSALFIPTIYVKQQSSTDSCDRYDFKYDFVTYKWPSWLNPQSKQLRTESIKRGFQLFAYSIIVHHIPSLACLLYGCSWENIIIYTCTLMWMPNYCLYWKNWFWILAHVSRGAAAISVFAQVVGLWWGSWSDSCTIKSTEIIQIGRKCTISQSKSATAL